MPLDTTRLNRLRMRGETIVSASKVAPGKIPPLLILNWNALVWRRNGTKRRRMSRIRATRSGRLSPVWVSGISLAALE